MKNILTILLICTFLSCKAQSVIKPLDGRESCPSNDTNCYDKDVTNEFEKYVGTWKYTNGNTEITFKLKKELHYQLAPNRNYQDMLVGEYQYIENGVEKVNTLANFDNASISGYGHNISGRSLKYRLPSMCTSTSAIAEIKVWVLISDPADNDIMGEIYLRYVNINGTEKLEMCIFDYTVTGNDLNARIAIPDGNYELVKQ